MRHVRSRENWLYLGRDKNEKYGDWLGSFEGLNTACGGRNTFVDNAEDAKNLISTDSAPEEEYEDDDEEGDDISDGGENPDPIEYCGGGLNITEPPIDDESDDSGDSGHSGDSGMGGDSGSGFGGNSGLGGGD